MPPTGVAIAVLPPSADRETIGPMASHEDKVTVLIVDDHPSFRAVAQIVLETDGFLVIGTASDGESGVAATLVLASSRDSSDFGSLVTESGARGFLTKADLSGDAIRALVA